MNQNSSSWQDVSAVGLCTVVQFLYARNIYVQGVPRNMTIARRLESRLWYLNLFVTFSILSTLTCMILETIST